MATIVINEELLEKNKLSPQEFITLLSIAFKVNLKYFYPNLLNRELIQPNNNSIPYSLTFKGQNLLEGIMIDVSSMTTEEKLNKLATSLQELFPPGKKEGTGYYWRGNKVEIVKKLKGFFKRYGNYPHEDIIKATQKYVNSYQDKTYMQLLKYFIWKLKPNGEEISELLTYLENMNDSKEDNTTTQDWTSTLI